MIIICNNCETRYHVEDKDIDGEGRKVRCSNCNHSWVQSPLPNQDDEEAILSFEVDKKIITGRMEENVQQTKDNLSWLQSSALILLLFVFIALFLIPRSEISVWLRPLYSAFGVYDTYKLEFENANFEYDREDIIIKSTIINNSSETKFLPNMKINLYSDIGEVLRTIYIVNKEEQIEKGKKKELTQRVKKIPENVKYITLDIGNKLEMFFQ